MICIFLKVDFFIWTKNYNQNLPEHLCTYMFWTANPRDFTESWPGLEKVRFLSVKKLHKKIFLGKVSQMVYISETINSSLEKIWIVRFPPLIWPLFQRLSVEFYSGLIFICNLYFQRKVGTENLAEMLVNRS